MSGEGLARPEPPHRVGRVRGNRSGGARGRSRWVLLLGFGLVVAGLATLALVGSWGYRGPELIICQGPCTPPTVILTPSLPMLEPTAFMALAIVSAVPLVYLKVGAWSVRLAGGVATASVAIATFAHGLYPPPTLLDGITSVPYSSFTWTGRAALVLLGLGTALELWVLSEARGHVRPASAQYRYRRAPP